MDEETGPACQSSSKAGQGDRIAKERCKDTGRARTLAEAERTQSRTRGLFRGTVLAALRRWRGALPPWSHTRPMRSPANRARGMSVPVSNCDGEW
ncbi:hypothetical protein B8W95_13005, partial [Staphylococcus pasteuri]